jgi:hypothetical protein
MTLITSGIRVLVVSGLVAASLLLGVSSALLGTCGPFTDVAADAFCPFVLEVFYLGITTGTTPTTYDPASSVSRLQMAAFLSRTVDGTLKRASRRAAIDRFWTPQDTAAFGLTTIGSGAYGIRFDGADLWVACGGSQVVSRVRASDGKLLETWSAADNPFGVLVALGRVFVTGNTTPAGKLYMIDPSKPVGAVTIVSSNLPGGASGIAFDGVNIWTANQSGSVSIVTPGAWTVSTSNITVGSSDPVGALYDGTNIWITDGAAGTLVKLNPSGVVLQTVTLGSIPTFPVFDGTNIWVPQVTSNSVTVVRASNGSILQTLTGNGLINPYCAAFDGERILITNSGGSTVSLWKAADLTGLGAFAVALNSPGLATSDGLNFWITFPFGSNRIQRF